VEIFRAGRGTQKRLSASPMARAEIWRSSFHADHRAVLWASPSRCSSSRRGAGINRVQAGHAHRLVPSAAFLNTGAARPGFGSARFGAVVCLCVLIDLPAGMASWVA